MIAAAAVALLVIAGLSAGAWVLLYFGSYWLQLWDNESLDLEWVDRSWELEDEEWT